MNGYQLSKDGFRYKFFQISYFKLFIPFLLSFVLFYISIKYEIVNFNSGKLLIFVAVMISMNAYTPQIQYVPKRVITRLEVLNVDV